MVDELMQMCILECWKLRKIAVLSDVDPWDPSCVFCIERLAVSLKTSL